MLLVAEAVIYIYVNVIILYPISLESQQQLNKWI